MDKKLLVRFIKGETSADEAGEVISWIGRNEDNSRYFSGLKDSLLLAEMTSPEAARYDADGAEASWKAIGKRIGESDETPSCEAEGERRKRDEEQWNQGEEQRNQDEEHRKWDDEQRNQDEERRKRRRILWQRVAGIAAVVCLIASVALNVSQKHRIDSISASGGGALTYLEAIPQSSYYTERGVKGRVILPDGSAVWMNSDSKINFPEHFAQGVRRVNFEGEGYFEVAKNPDRPMVITTTRGTEVRVLGTRLYISSYSNEDAESVTLISGEVNVKHGGDAEFSLRPMQTVCFRRQVQVPAVASSDTVSGLAWKRGELLFKEEPMAEVFKKLERWHGVDIVVRDSSVFAYNLTASFGAESISQIMEEIGFTSSITSRIVGDTVFVSKKKI